MKIEFTPEKPWYYDCCTHYTTDEYLDGYVMWKPIKIKYCKNCGTVHLTANWFWSFIFRAFLQWFWDGYVVVYDKIEEEEKCVHLNK